MNLQPDGIYDGARFLGPQGALLCGKGELRALTESDGVVHVKMPQELDWAFAIGNRLVAVEAKRQPDLLQSISTRRLARQLRACRDEVGPDGIVCLALRGGVPHHFHTNVMAYLVSLQLLGILLLPLSTDDSEVMGQLGAYKLLMAEDSRAPFQAIAGSDSRKTKQRMVASVRGVGPAMLQRLYARWPDGILLLRPTDEQLRDCKVPESVLTRIKEAL